MMSEEDNEQNLEKIASIIQDLGYKAEIRGEIIFTAMSRVQVGVLLWPHMKAIQMSFGFYMDQKQGFGLKEANKFNNTYGFVKCVLTEKGVRFVQDFFSDVSGPTAKEQLRQIFNSWEISISNALEALSVAEKASQAGEGASSGSV